MDKFTKAGHWFPCAIDLLIDISAIKITVLDNDDYVYALYMISLNLSHNLSSRLDKSDQAFLDAWSRLVSIGPLQALLKSVTTEKGQDRYTDALNTVHDH